jgi:protein-S-isoprenylcysteine O-methyltransferase Ste14
MSGATNFWIRWRVRTGYAVGLAAFRFANPQPKWIICGAGVAALGLLLRAAAAGHLHKHEKLAATGPYAYTRNPLYLGSSLLGAGFGVASHSWVSTALLAAYLLVFYPVVMRREEKELEKLYGSEFVVYAARVPAFWPRLFANNSSGERFSWALYRRNREYEAAIGSVLAVALLWVLMLWRR